jgi:ribonucleoside-triphosphate reductase
MEVEAHKIDTNIIIDNYVNGSWWEIKENANSGFSYQDMKRQLSSIAIKRYWLTKVYDEDIKNMYLNGLAHIHDLGDYSVYCVGWSLEDLLLMGFKGQKGKQTSKPARHLSTALGQSVNQLFTNQNEAAGAQAYSSFDTYMAPFIRYDGLDYKQVKQNLQKFRFDMNVQTRNGNQPPFTNVTLDQRILPHFENEQVIRGGKYTGDVYGDFEDEIKMFNDAWWEVAMEGDGVGRPQPFPIETLNVTKDFDWGDEKLFKAVALRGSPYFANFVNSDMNPEDSFSMCCRYRVDKRELIKRNGGFFGSGVKTGSIGVVTLNLPLIAYLSKEEDKYFELISSTMDTAMKSLELKRDEIEKLMNINFYPNSRIYLQSTFDRWGKWWQNHFSTIGLIGMNEATLNLFGISIVDTEGYNLAIRTMDFMNNKLIEFQELTGNNYNLEATPAEGTSFRTARRDKMRYPDIITAGVPESPYYTNSTTIPTTHQLSLGRVVQHQNDLLKKYTGGSVLHIWNGEEHSHWEGVSRMVKGVIENSEIPYFTYTPTTSVCPVHGLISGKHWTCPTCNAETEVWSRITGYFAEVSRWNDGKQQEFAERPHYNIADSILTI